MRFEVMFLARVPLTGVTLSSGEHRLVEPNRCEAEVRVPVTTADEVHTSCMRRCRCICAHRDYRGYTQVLIECLVLIDCLLLHMGA